MAANKPNQLLTCPYNPSHQIESSRMQYHLTKCREQYPKSNKVSCPFDATHLVNEAELDYHVRNACSKRELFDRQRYVVDDGVEFQPLAPVAVVASCDENWDNDNFTSYEPEAVKTTGHIIRKVKGATPSQRRAARMDGVKNYKPDAN